MEADWILIYETDSLIDVTFLQNKLEDHLLNPVMINKSGQPYTVFQSFEIYVHIEVAEKALEIIDQYKNE